MTGVEVHGRVHGVVGHEARAEDDGLRLDDAVVGAGQKLRVF